MSASEQIYRYKVVSIGTLLLSFYGNVNLLAEYGKLSEIISVTPFSNFLIFLIIYWLVIYILQIIYLQKNLDLNIDNSDTNIVNITKSLIYFNVLTLIWTWLFKYKWFIFSEIILLIELFVVLNNYMNHKVYSFRPWRNFLVINLTIGSLPLSWIFITIFWNGALMIPVNNLATRILANIFIWDFLLIGLGFLYFFNDVTMGLSLAFLVLGMALNQLFLKFIALQWIFGFVISGLLFLFSLLTLFFKPNLTEQILVIEEDETLPLVSDDNEPQLQA